MNVIPVLRTALEQSGSTSPTDVETMIQVYIDRGSLSRADRAHLDGLGQHERHVWMLDRYGSDAIRAAAVAYKCGIGGRR